MQFLIALDQLINTLIHIQADGRGMADETISARAFRCHLQGYISDRAYRPGSGAGRQFARSRLSAVLEGFDMGSSAPNTQGQITVTELAKGICARIVDADVSALESSRAISSLDALTTPRAAMRPRASRLYRRRYLGLWQRAHRPGVDLDIEASGIYLHQRPGIAAVAGYGAKRPASCRDGVAVQPPRAAQCDGEAATIIVGHGSHLSARENKARFFVDVGSAIIKPLFPDERAENNRAIRAIGTHQPFFGFGIHGGRIDHVTGGLEVFFDFGHFGLLPLISGGSVGKQCASHELNYTHQTNERKNFFKLFFGGRDDTAKPSNARLTRCFSGNRPIAISPGAARSSAGRCPATTGRCPPRRAEKRLYRAFRRMPAPRNIRRKAPANPAGFSGLRSQFANLCKLAISANR